VNRLGGVGAITGCTPTGLAVAVGTAVANAVLVSRYQPTRAWKYLMWEGGVLEWLTALSFIAAGAVSLWLALTSGEGRVKRAWFVVFGVGCLVLAGEELNWGRGMLILNLDDPEFTAHYNIQAGNLHNFAHPLVPILVFVGLAAVLRLAAPWSLRLVPLPTGFLNAIVVTAASILFMDLRGDYFLFLDEVLEWSSAILLLCLALHYRYGWFFLSRTGAGAPTA
jgi:hypothetical protein